MARNVKFWIVANLIAIVLFLVYTTYQKEEILHSGTLILLELIPSDPRSLIQGDYMDLRYLISSPEQLPQRGEKGSERKGYCVVEREENGVAVLKRYQLHPTPLAEDEFLIAYKRSASRVSLGAESYFFEEGSQEKFLDARYGGLKVDAKGNSILIGLYDVHKNLIQP